MFKKIRAILFMALVLSNPIATGLLLWWLFSREGTLGLYKWQPNDYRLVFNIVGGLGVVAPLLALLTVGLRCRWRRVGLAVAILTMVVALVGLAVPLALGGYVLSASLELSSITPPVLLVMDGSGAHGVPNLALTFRTAQPTQNTLRYGVDALDQQVTEAQPATEHALILRDLRPATRYQWQLNNGEVYRFSTPGAVGPDAVLYHFGAGADAHIGRETAPGEVGGPAVTRNILNTVAAAENPFHTFFLVGDIVDLGMSNSHWDELLPILARPSYTTPLRPVMGNHDALINGQGHYFAYLYPDGMAASTGTRLYYRIDAGPVHFIVLHMPWSSTETFTPQQRDWFVKQMEAIPATDWAIVLLHSMVYASSDDYQGLPWYDPPEMVQEVAPLLEKYRVDLVISGHDHQMEFLQRNGVNYCIIGTLGGPPDRDPTHISPASIWRNFGAFGFLDATVRAETIDLSFRDPAGGVLKTFTVPSATPAP